MVTPAMVAAVVQQLRERQQSELAARTGCSGCCSRFWSGCLQAPLRPLDNGLHAVCEASEVTTARVFGPANASKQTAATSAPPLLDAAVSPQAAAIASYTNAAQQRSAAALSTSITSQRPPAGRKAAAGSTTPGAAALKSSVGVASAMMAFRSHRIASPGNGATGIPGAASGLCTAATLRRSINQLHSLLQRGVPIPLRLPQLPICMAAWTMTTTGLCPTMIDEMVPMVMTMRSRLVRQHRGLHLRLLHHSLSPSLRLRLQLNHGTRLCPDTWRRVIIMTRRSLCSLSPI